MSLMQTVPTHPQTNGSIADALRSDTLLAHSARVVVASLLVAACSHIAFPVPFSPVPFTMQPFAVLLVGMLLGPWAGFAAMALYLVEGAAGLPVFTPFGLPGLARLVGPTGGYLFSYPLAAALAGSAYRSVRFRSFLMAGVAAMLVTYLCGTLWLSYSLALPLRVASAQALLPFALPDLLKACAAAGIASTVLRASHKR